MGIPLVVEVATEVPPGAVAVGVPVQAGAEGPTVVGGLGPAPLPGLPERPDPAWCARQGFKARPGQSLTVRAAPDGPSVVLLGLGAPAGADPERWRRAAAALVRAAGEGGTAALLVPAGAEGPGGTDGTAGTAAEDATFAAASELGRAVAEGAALASYRFDDFRSTPRPGPVERLVVVVPDAAVQGPWSEGVAMGARAAAAVGFARDLVNTPPSDLTPAELARRVTEELGHSPRVRTEVWDAEEIAAERLGGLLGVSRGSAQPPVLIRADYEPAEEPATGRPSHVVLVGKGITFDSGGLSLKTADGMATMKTDMSGAAIVLATVSACAAAGVRARVTALAPVTENMPGGSALKPGDVLRIRNGATIEVLNTDAEGRLVLADALSLATEMEPDAIVDVATLTGAAAVALGTSVAPVFSNNEPLRRALVAAAARTGEQLWPMPLPEEYADHIDSEVADMKNTGRAGQAGAISAALLLQRFVDSVPWAHIDIAGTGRSTESAGYLSKGGTAFGVRTLLRFLSDYEVG